MVGTRSIVGEREVGVRGERLGEGLELLGVDREARGGAVAAEALRCADDAASAPWRSNEETERPEPFQSPSPLPAISTTGRLKRSTSREATMPITPSCQSSSQST